MLHSPARGETGVARRGWNGACRPSCQPTPFGGEDHDEIVRLVGKRGERGGGEGRARSDTMMRMATTTTCQEARRALRHREFHERVLGRMLRVRGRKDDEMIEGRGRTAHVAERSLVLVR